jgi:peptide/nickel transport system permease protein
MAEREQGLGLYVLRRILQAVPLLFGVVVINFTIIQLAPGDPIYALVGDFPAPEEYIRQVRHEFGLDRSVPERLLAYLANLARGNLGFSFANRKPVLQIVGERIPATALLTLTGLGFAALAGVTLGILSARRPYSWLDNTTSTASLLSFSVPVFWLAQILIIVFALWLGWLPGQGMVSLRADPSGLGYYLDVGAHLLLPAFALSARFLAINSRLSRASMLEVLGRDFIRTARAKGVSELRVLTRHALPNALLPIVTIIGYNFGFVLAGSALVETVFAWPGIGRLLYDSIFARDYPVLMGIFLVVAVSVIIANLITDILYAYLDPRIRY